MDYTIINNDIFTDKRLSLQDMGIHCMIMSFLQEYEAQNYEEPSYEEVLEFLVNHGKDSKEEITQSITNLIECGYFSQELIQEMEG